MIPPWTSGAIAATVTFLLAACTVQPALEVAPSAQVFPRRYDVAAALVTTQDSARIRRATLLPSPCVTATAIEAAYAKGLERALAERLRKLFGSVDVVSSLAEAHGHPLVFEASLASVGYRHGCQSSPETFVQVDGRLRALDAQGREGWQARTTTKRQAITTMPTDGAIDDALSHAIGSLVDDWSADFSALPPVTVAAMVGQPLTASADGRTSAIAPGRVEASQELASPPPAPPRFSSAPLPITFPPGEERPDDVAVIIGNADYSRLAKDVPDARPAYVDAESVRAYVTRSRGIRDGNVIFLKDATFAQMTRVFGSKDQPRGQLHDWIKAGRSRVFVYFSGHGSAESHSGTPYLVPADADSGRIELSGYPLSLLYDNLSQLPAEKITVVLEACFSGLSPAGSLLGKASPLVLEVKAPQVPSNMTVVTAAMSDQLANWEDDGSSSLFTKYFLTGMSGRADEPPHGNGDGKVTLDELDAFLANTMTYFARRHYGRDQRAQILGAR